MPNIGEFVDPSLLPTGKVRVAAFDGENADPINGREMGEGVRAFTPWGELAYALGKKAGYETLRKSDEQRRAPGAENVRALFSGEPAIILLDELSIYLRKVKGREDAAQLTPFLTVLFKAVESSPGAALVFTLAIGKSNRATDAYGEENEYLAHKLAEAESVAARKATLLDPTSERETVQVLRRRLFSRSIRRAQQKWPTRIVTFGAETRPSCRPRRSTKIAPQSCWPVTLSSCADGCADRQTLDPRQLPARARHAPPRDADGGASVAAATA